MAKHACPSCGKQFDFEKNGWICPYCGGVILHSAEQAVYAREQQEQRQKAQKPKKKARNFGGAVWQSVQSKVLLFVVFCVIIMGSAVLLQGKTLAQLKQSGTTEVTEQTIQCGETISIAPYSVQITGATWAEHFDGFPEEVKPPSGGTYLLVTFACSAFAQSADTTKTAEDDVMWACLDTGDGYLLPQHATVLTGSDEIRTELYDLGMGYQLNRRDSFLVFLVDEAVQTDQLALRIYAGEPAVNVNMSENHAQHCYVIPLEVTP